jgi:hypothetical protein
MDNACQVQHTANVDGPRQVQHTANVDGPRQVQHTANVDGPRQVTPTMVSTRMSNFNSRTTGEDKWLYYLKIHDILTAKAPNSFQVKPGPPIEISIALKNVPHNALIEIYEILNTQNE